MFGGSLREPGRYIPAEHVSGQRHVWPRLPFLCKPCGCYLCGQDFDSKPELQDHWCADHLSVMDDFPDGVDVTRAEEEVSKRLFWEECMES